MGKRRRQRVSTGREASARAKASSKKATSLPGELKPAEKLEDRLTVFWMLTTLFTLAVMALGGAAFLYDDYAAAEGASSARAVYDYARFTTAVLGLMSLAMTPIVLWMRQVAPPKAITAFVVATATVGLSWALLSDPLSSSLSSDSESQEPAPQAASP